MTGVLEGPHAGLEIWEVQKAQQTGLCVGLDPHYNAGGPIGRDVYEAFADDERAGELREVFRHLERPAESKFMRDWVTAPESSRFMAGMTNYFLTVIEAAWDSGIRVFKPQGSFFERTSLFSMFVLEILCVHLEKLTNRDRSPHFKMLDIKRGDIMSTQEAYYDAYLSPPDREVIPGMGGRFSFDAMTVTTWMGADVLTPGLDFFRAGKGAIVVTRTSNPSGTTLQDGVLLPNEERRFSEKQQPFVYTPAMAEELENLLGRLPTSHEVLLYQTTKFSADNGLDRDGMSPLFSVMGATVKMWDSFRQIRGDGAVALGPGFGHQKGGFAQMMPLIVRDGPRAGFWGILSSSRAHNFPWMKKYGGSGDPRQLRDEMARAIISFRGAERASYVEAGVDFPF